MSTIERFLLVSAIVLFVFVFYRWLMRFLHRNELQGSFPYVFPFGEKTLAGKQELKVDLPRKSIVNASIVDASGKDVLEICNSEYNPGVHSIAFNCEGIAPGAYEVKIRFSNQTSRIQINIG